ncbi:unnamed protein product, partial [Dicrocoelium dendriticum]
MDNYRPIYHTPVVSRTLEKLIKNGGMKFINSLELIDRSKHGFLNKRSCVTCQLHYLNHISNSIDSGYAIILLFLDMEKACDRVPHKRLLNKIASFGIQDTLLGWLLSYLSGHSQVVIIADHRSSPSPITSSVIQGSVLGALLFLLDVNDISAVISHGMLFRFADDIKILYRFRRAELQDALLLIQKDLHSLEKRCGTWMMKFSAKNSGIMYCGCSIPEGSITLNDEQIC